MKKMIALIAMLPIIAIAQQTKTTSKPAVKKTIKSNTKPTKEFVFKTGLDSLSYSLGTRIAMNLSANHIDTLSYNAFIEGLKDIFKKSNLKFDENTINQIINTKVQEMSVKKSSKEKANSQKFLEENKKRNGVNTTSSGLQYEVITMGTGPKPTLQDTVVCHYKGTLINGFEFDNSFKRGEPISFPVSGVIKGWTEALQLMPKGSKWKLYIPSDLGYGNSGAGNDIPGGAALIFEVELIDIK